MELTPDTLLNNRYRIMEKLGQGGMGSVYLAVDLALDAQVAVKLNRNPAQESTSQFLREARLLASLRHPNLPRVTDYFILNGSQFLVMDYIAGKDLDTLLREHGQLPLEQVLDWGRQLGNALSYLHQQQPPVVHRDVKPANVRLSSEGAAILVDFGIAKVVDANQATATGAAGYTPGYAPPEQYGGLLRTGPHTDQYSFAALLYHLLTGQKPADSVQRALGQTTLASLRAMRPDVPPHVQLALEKALTLKPDDRFASMDDLLRALNTPLTGAAAAAAASDVPTAPDGITMVPGQAGPSAPDSSGATEQPAGPPTVPPAAGSTAEPGSSTVVSGSSPAAPTFVGSASTAGSTSAAASSTVNTSAAGRTSAAGSTTAAGSSSATRVAQSAPTVVQQPGAASASPTRPEAAGATVRIGSGAAATAGAAAAPPRKPNWLLIGGLGLLVVLALGAAVVLGGGLVLWNSLQGKTTPTLPMIAQVTETPQPVTATVVQAVEATATPQPTETPTDTPTPPPSPSPTSTETLVPTETPTVTITPVPLGKGGMVVFASDRADGQTLQLWSMRLALADSGQVVASDLKQLTSSPGDKRWPVWSPDGTRLLYVAAGGEGMGLDIWVINGDGSGEPANLTQRKGDDTEPAWSPDGNWIAFTNNGREDKVRMLYLIHPDGSGLKRLSTDQEEFGATWSPDMTLLGSIMRIGVVHVMFTRSPLGTNTAATPVHPYFVTPQRFDRLELLGNLGQVYDPAWSPDGSMLAYTREEGRNLRVYLSRYPVKLPEQDIVRLTDGPSDSLPVWAPDGQWILFNSERDGNPEIYGMRDTGQLQTNLTLSPGRDMDAAWQPLP